MKLGITLLIAAVTALASAQGSQAGPPSAGPVGGSPAIKAFNQAGDAGRLLLMPAVQTDLALSDDQKAQLKDLFAKKTREQLQASPVNINQRIREVLTKEQFQRLDEIRLQVAGLASVVAPRVARALKLTDDQVVKIRAIIQKERDAQKIQVPKPTHPFLELKAKVDPQIRELLTPEQQSAWDAMLGKPFIPAAR